MNKIDFNKEISQGQLFEVLENQTTLDALRTFLREKKLPHSATSWAKMIADRVEPALSSGSITWEELIGLIRDAEEHGNKHVRLYYFDDNHLDELRDSIKSKVVAAWAKDKGFPGSGEYVFAAYPPDPIVIEVRTGDGEDTDALILKIARTEHRRKRGILTEIDGEEVYLAPRVPFRAVDVLKIHTNGLIEIRLDPRTEPPISYSGTANAVLSQVSGLVNVTRIAELSLGIAKNSFSDQQKKQQAVENFELYETQHKNDRGDRIQSSSQADQGGILTSDVMTKVIKQFTVGDPEAYCEKVRVSYNFGKVKKINAILSEDSNEIIFTAGLSREEYDEVLNAILEVNSEK
ncbi:MAG: hypothetical protein MnENMB40S_34220 [Rhizobiaceae bacterium MnEN-MB40S]|nr:MAG: hypothetical protein MnENMB40S_34220 [Rhizobiaceae bacterium MnEN-MB40S]